MCRSCVSKAKNRIFAGRHESTPGRMHAPEPDIGEAGINGRELLVNPNPADTHAPMRNVGSTLGVNPHTVGHYSNDMDATPIIFNRHGTRWGDVQLKNGLANGVASGRRWPYRGAGWYDVIMPVVPGQTRQSGGTLPGNYAAKGAAPTQWADAQGNTVASNTADDPGGPGFMMGQSLFNPGSGG